MAARSDELEGGFNLWSVATTQTCLMSEEEVEQHYLLILENFEERCNLIKSEFPAITLESTDTIIEFYNKALSLKREFNILCEKIFSVQSSDIRFSPDFLTLISRIKTLLNESTNDGINWCIDNKSDEIMRARALNFMEQELANNFLKLPLNVQYQLAPIVVKKAAHEELTQEEQICIETAIRLAKLLTDKAEKQQQSSVVSSVSYFSYEPAASSENKVPASNLQITKGL